MKTRTRCLLTLAYAWSAVALGAAAGQSIGKQNGSITIEAGQEVGDVSTVNGSVTTGPQARAAGVEATIEPGEPISSAARRTGTAGHLRTAFR
jgi:hypothetical protein